MDAMRESWTDERLDDFRSDVSRRFDAVDKRFDAVDRHFAAVERRMETGFGKCEVELHRVNDRLDGLSKAMVFGSLMLSSSMLGGLITVAFAIS
jgi:hypothetical protein